MAISVINEVSKMLGELKSDVKHMASDLSHVRKTGDATGKEVKTISDQVNKNVGRINGAEKRLDKMEPALAGAIKTTWTVNAIILATVAFFSTVGGALFKVVLMLFR